MRKVFRKAVYAPLRFPGPYNMLQRLVGASRDRAAFVREHVVFRPGDKIVDAGCGTGSALEFLPSVTYFGFDPSPDYIRAAQSRYGSRGRFLCGDANSPRVRQLAQRADARLSLGVLPPLTDIQIGEILRRSGASLRPESRVVLRAPG